MTTNLSDSYFDIVLDEQQPAPKPAPGPTEKAFYTGNVRIACCVAAAVCFLGSKSVMAAILPFGISVIFLHSIGALVASVAIIALVSQLYVSYENSTLQLQRSQRTLDDAFFDSPFFDQNGFRLNRTLIKSLFLGGLLRFCGIYLLILAVYVGEGGFAASLTGLYASIAMVAYLSKRDNGMRVGSTIKAVIASFC